MVTGQWDLLELSPAKTCWASHVAVSHPPSVVPAAKLKPIAARQVAPARVWLEAVTVMLLMSRKACL